MRFKGGIAGAPSNSARYGYSRIEFTLYRDIKLHPPLIVQIYECYGNIGRPELFLYLAVCNHVPVPVNSLAVCIHVPANSLAG